MRGFFAYFRFLISTFSILRVFPRAREVMLIFRFGTALASCLAVNCREERKLFLNMRVKLFDMISTLAESTWCRD